MRHCILGGFGIPYIESIATVADVECHRPRVGGLGSDMRRGHLLAKLAIQVLDSLQHHRLGCILGHHPCQLIVADVAHQGVVAVETVRPPQ